jgi:hypothetical protein
LVEFYGRSAPTFIKRSAANYITTDGVKSIDLKTKKMLTPAKGKANWRWLESFLIFAAAKKYA